MDGENDSPCFLCQLQREGSPHAVLITFPQEYASPMVTKRLSIFSICAEKE